MVQAAAAKMAADNPVPLAIGVVTAGAVIYLIFSKVLGTSEGLIRDTGKELKKGAKYVAKEAGEFADWTEDKAEDVYHGAKSIGRSAVRAPGELADDVGSALSGAKKAVKKSRVVRGAKKIGSKARKKAGKAKKALGRLFG